MSWITGTVLRVLAGQITLTRPTKYCNFFYPTAIPYTTLAWCHVCLEWPYCNFPQDLWQQKTRVVGCRGTLFLWCCLLTFWWKSADNTDIHRATGYTILAWYRMVKILWTLLLLMQCSMNRVSRVIVPDHPEYVSDNFQNLINTLVFYKLHIFHTSWKSTDNYLS